ncbi:MAG: DUF2235 domain-containing protein [Gammaproteobacteria bacterium]|nr:DUF2235 domain-containing protein [Gammaproteobacteria bacterium]MBQ0840211.1 DUF2235 domain-containing protein [Gammaproteobacteria bacterium]
MTDKRVVSSDLDYSGEPRHLLVFMDGTWNDENGIANDGITTNIYKLFRALEGELKNESIPHIMTHEKHIALYYRGIGNDDDNNMIGSWFKGAFGGSEKRIRDSAYCGIVEHYRKGDSISIFGFSRGSASARLLASDLHKEGVVASIEVHTNDEENKSTGATESVYKKYDDKSKKKAKVNVSFLGIFDTVGAFGIPVDLGFGFQKLNLFKDLDVAANVKQVVHCVSIDESRDPFIPTLCNKAKHIDEVWFTGVHADIGGGYRQNHLSKIPTAYMVDKLKQTFASKPIQFNEDKLAELTHYEMSDVFQLHYHGDGVVKERRKIQVIENSESSTYKPKIHKSVFSLIESTNMYLSTPLDSFAKLDKIQYCPKSVNGLMGKYKEVS